MTYPLCDAKQEIIHEAVNFILTITFWKIVNKLFYYYNNYLHNITNKQKQELTKFMYIKGMSRRERKINNNKDFWS